ncbi:alginate O-acetyltransferase AlgF [Pseudomonas cichorii]|uniref:Alginate biosynthesis protein AlgF n=1 Tax=Pseudomonas lijiangensis TaxID=2995658 RepID=A0ABX8HXH3_9PSED|nr:MULTISPECIES: alginate O-acetyltransferase AlgF [Pseudomonas syringae group]MBX8490229.1 alginate O-acetyltransferase AlgF [Pseudomonas cichorii]MBX8498717.1 alginate O-acetyltransferase AlgF [Pseudomonas lijiangensis]MBX8504413.1 alginate O-acetyltransferase AlgF [Pseudomonas lijiangensis]MBX8508885.1 alginate O-acetyltransferase AlgF [Pseudomonas cichorii]MBX8520564.1 alginate O-acetyltransferase AlgF [Pseudomonas cichorii]
MTLQHTPNRSAKKSLFKTCALAATLGLMSLQAFAGDSALYGPTAPKGSTFVRVYNASNAEISASVGNTNLNEVAPLGSTAFSFMPQGDYTAKLGSQTLPVKLAGDHYYTIVNNASGKPQLVEEAPFKNKQKSLVRVQNLSDKSLTLKTADGKTEVVKTVGAKGTGEREINPVKVSLALYDGDKKVTDVKPVALERGEAAVLYITGSGSNLSPVWVKPPVATR